MADSQNDLSALSAGDKRALLQDLLARRTVSEYPLSHGQRALWTLYELDPASSGYNVECQWRIASEVDSGMLRQALQRLVDRHAVLRTTFATRDGEPLQRTAATAPVAFTYSDTSGWPEGRLEQRLIEEARRPFDLRRAPAFRAHLFTRGADDHILQFVFHHIVYDLRSGAQLARELAVLYDSIRAGVTPPLPPVGVTYEHYVRWQQQLIAGPDGERLWAYWQRQLELAPGAVDLPLDKRRPAVQTFDGESHSFQLSAQLSDQVRQAARAAGTTPYVFLLTVFFVLLYRHTRQDDIVVGSPGAGRSHAEFDSVVGYFVNPLVLRARLDGRMSFERLVAAVRETVLSAIEHGDYPFPLIVERLGVPRDPSRSPLFQIAFTWNALDALDSGSTADAIAMQQTVARQEGANFDIELAIAEKDGGLGGWWRYNTDLFDAASIARMAGQYVHLLDAATRARELPIGALPLVSADEHEELLRQPRVALPSPPPVTTLHHWFERQAATRPQAAAVTCAGKTLSYDELNRRANQVAHALAARGVRPADAVGLYLERSELQPVAVLGILKAGATYVPVDAAYPSDRVNYVLSDARVRAVVTDASLAVSVSESAVAVCVDDSALIGFADTNPMNRVDADSLAYIIYTSGSTGRPKGVGVSHANAVRLFSSTERWCGFGPEDVWTLFHSLAFDFSVWEMWGALLYGGRLVVVPYWVSRSPEAFHALLADEGVTVLNQTPSAFRQLIEVDEGAAAALRLRYVIFGGEALDVGALRPWVQRHGIDRPALVNMYGITETTVHVTYRKLSLHDVMDGGRSVIGEPIDDLQMYLLDERLEPVPVNMGGEIFVGGTGVARGYLGKPRLTAERFLPDPFSGIAGSRLYRSGDAARRLGDGDVEYLGRLDQQVKVRGFRIELGEIEQALRTHPAVRDVVISADRDQDGATRIAAYVIPDAVTAGPVRRLLSWEKQGRLTGRSWCELPNGIGVMQLNRNETEFLYEEIFAGDRYFRNGVSLGPGACVFDIGANIGMFSLYAATRHPDATIYAFEPIPPVFEVLQLNAELHGRNIQPVAVALSDGVGRASFTFYPNVSIFSGRFGDTSREREVVRTFLKNQRIAGDADDVLLDELLQDRLASETVECPLTTVSAVMRARGIEHIDLLKVDVEKSEVPVLNGIDADDWPRIRQVIVEVHDENGALATVRGILERAGFHLTVEQDPALGGTGLFSVYAVREADTSPVPEPAANMSWSSAGRLSADIRTHVGRTLPEYMIPSAIVLLDAFPLTSNGKLDRRALPAAAARPAGVSPRTPLEQQVADIWQAVLHVDRVGVDEDFFALGGHSLLATKVISRIRAEMSVELPLRVMFEAPTVEAMALAVLEQQATASDPEALLQALSAVERTSGSAVGDEA